MHGLIYYQGIKIDSRFQGPVIPAGSRLAGRAFVKAARAGQGGALLFAGFLDKPVDNGPGVAVFFQAIRVIGIFGRIGRCRG